MINIVVIRYLKCYFLFYYRFRVFSLNEKVFGKYWMYLECYVLQLYCKQCFKNVNIVDLITVIIIIWFVIHTYYHCILFDINYGKQKALARYVYFLSAMRLHFPFLSPDGFSDPVLCQRVYNICISFYRKKLFT